MSDKLIPQKRIVDLITRFQEKYASYKNYDYNKKKTRHYFIGPFFTAIDLEIDNEEGYT
jgi:hypothetical protein